MQVAFDSRTKKQNGNVIQRTEENIELIMKNTSLKIGKEFYEI